jgi:hypothetical protein
MAAASRAFAQQAGQGQGAMSFYDRGSVRIRYKETGAGFPLLLIAGGGLNSTISALANPFDPIAEFKDEFRCIASDLRNANSGQSSGPLEVDRPWDAFTDDHIGLMDHLGIEKFMVLGFCSAVPSFGISCGGRPIVLSPPCWRSPADHVQSCATISTTTT